MNEPGAAATTPEPAPTTVDIARETVEQFNEAETNQAAPEQRPADGNGSGGQPTAEEVSEAEALLRGEGYATPHKPDGREHYIARSRVLKMIENGLEKRGAKFKEDQAAWEKEKATLAQEAQGARAWRALMDGPDPRAVLTRMAEVDPRYQTFLTPAQAAAAAARAPDDDPEPEPDLHMGNGQYTYSLQGIKKLREWDRRQIERAVESKLQPLHQQQRDAQERLRLEQSDRELEQRTQSRLAKARSWQGWKENEPEILKALQADTAEAQARGELPKLSLEEAYIQVVLPKLTAATREQTIKQINEAPRSTAVGKTGPEPTRAPGALSSREIAAKVFETATKQG